MVEHYLKKEEKIRETFKAKYPKYRNVDKRKVSVGKKQHEFDIYEEGKIAGGITTGTWKTRGGNNNTGSQDRAKAEILWLSLAEDVERRVLIITNKEMFENLIKQLQGANFKKKIEIIFFNYKKKSFMKKEYL